MLEDTQIGAMISEQHLEKVLSYIAIGKSEGANLDNSPAIFSNCEDDMQIVREEIFGPVMAVLSFDNEEEVIRANNTQYGLGAGVKQIKNIWIKIYIGHLEE